MALDRKNLNPASQVLADLLFQLFPEWLLYAGTSEFEEPGSLYVDVPSSAHDGHYLQIEHRGDTFEVAAGDGSNRGRAEALFVFRAGKEMDAARQVIQFIREYINERLWLQVEPTAQFLDPGDQQRKLSADAQIFSWLGNFDR